MASPKSPKKSSPHRRKSIAGLNQNHPSIVPRGRRRAHSIVPGALSPQAKARRSLVPRKSILKAFANSVANDPSSQGSSQPSGADDTINATRSMEMTQDYAGQETTTRKSLGGRRVSFMQASYVRMYNPRRKSISHPDASQETPNGQSDENDYPGSSRRRRSSVRYSMTGSEDMDMTTIIQPGTFQPKGSAILDEEFDFDEEEEDYGEDVMEVTEAIQGHLSRKRSLSMKGRQPLAQVSTDASVEGNNSHSEVGNDSMQSAQSDATSEQSSYIMDFTVPLGQSLRPAEQDDVWLALKQMTHSGDQPAEPEISYEEEESIQDDGMPLDDAVERLLRARDSLPLSGSINNESIYEPQDDTFTDTDDSSSDGNEMDGNKTLNLSQVMGRQSTGLKSRVSIGHGSNMDESEIYGDIAAASQSTPRHSVASPKQQREGSQSTQTPQPRKSLIFQPPTPTDDITKSKAPHAAQPRTSSGALSASEAPSPSKATTPSRPTPITPSQAKARPTFSAAFAPPVARPSPKKYPLQTTSPSVTPSKRPYPGQEEGDNADQPSPAKRQALADKWMDVTESKGKSPSVSLNANRTTLIPQPLAPTFKAPVQDSAVVETDTGPPKVQSALRRPSGYYARRKSLAVSSNVPPSSENSTAPTGSSMTKNLRLGLGRASLDGTQAWTRSKGPDAKVISEPESLSMLKGKEKEIEVEAAVDISKADSQAVALPSSTRVSSVPSLAVPAPEPSPESVSLESDPVSWRLEAQQLSPANSTPTRLEQVPEEMEEEMSGNMEVDRDATQHWAQGVEQMGYQEEEVPSISIAQFFSITGVKFMDELTAPRRSMHPSQQPLRQPRNPGDIALAEYFAAMAINVPQLELYSRVSMDLEAWIAKSKNVFAQTEEEAEKVTPELFVEYARADEEGQAELKHQLNLIRTHTRYLAKSDWYDWKLQWVEGLRVTGDEAFASLENDARKLEEPKRTAAELIPILEKEHEDILRVLEQEQKEVAEIENGDADYLNELKATIAEQSIEIEALKAELTEGSDQLRWLQERSVELSGQMRESKHNITTAERVLRLKQTSTRSEVFRLKDELEALEDLHMFRITKVSTDLFEYIYSSLFQVTIPCKGFKPIVSQIKISRVGKSDSRYKDNFPKLSSFLLNAAVTLISHGNDLTVREIIHRLSDYWSSCAELRSQLTLLTIKYPVEIIVPLQNTNSALPSFRAKTMIMFPKPMAKAYVTFVFAFNTFSRWPLSLDTLDCEVEVAYGAIDRAAIMGAVVARLSQATPSESYACLLDACIEAQELYR